MENGNTSYLNIVLKSDFQVVVVFGISNSNLLSSFGLVYMFEWLCVCCNCLLITITTSCSSVGRSLISSSNFLLLSLVDIITINQPQQILKLAYINTKQYMNNQIYYVINITQSWHIHNFKIKHHQYLSSKNPASFNSISNTLFIWSAVNFCCCCGVDFFRFSQLGVRSVVFAVLFELIRMNARV